MKKYFPKQQGFVILFTILISTIILMIGLGIFSIATRETVLSGTSREAQYAFYAADAGVECALFAQSRGFLTGSGGTFECGAIPADITGVGLYPGNPFVFDILVDPVKKSCARVTVFDTTTESGAAARRVISQGYNICNANAKPLTQNPVLVERDLDVMFGTGVVANPNNPITPAPVGSGKDLGDVIIGGTLNNTPILNAPPANPSPNLTPVTPGNQ